MPSPHKHPSPSCWNAYRCQCAGHEDARHEGWEECRDLYNKQQAKYRERRPPRSQVPTGMKRGAQKRVLSADEVDSLRRQLGIKIVNGELVVGDPQGGNE